MEATHRHVDSQQFAFARHVAAPASSNGNESLAGSLNGCGSGGGGQQEASSQVRTLFVSGLPMDAKPRELYLLFRAYKVSLLPT